MRHPFWLDPVVDFVGREYHTVTNVFSTAFLAEVSRWPRLMVLPHASEALAPACEVAANLVRRDLGLAGALSVPGFEETPRIVFEEWREAVSEDLRNFGWWDGTVSVGLAREAGSLTMFGWVYRPRSTELPVKVSVSSPEREVARLGLEFVEAVLSVLEVAPTARAQQAMRTGRPASFEVLAAVGDAWARGSFDTIARRVRAGDFHPDAASVLDDERFDRRTGQRALFAALGRDPDNPQLAFLQWTFHDPKRGQRKRSLARDLARALQSAPGHGKAQMVFAHCIEQVPASFERIQAHATTAFRLLPENPYVANNLAWYLANLAIPAEQCFPIAEELLRAFPRHPWLLSSLPFPFIRAKRFDEALAIVDRYVELLRAPGPELTFWLDEKLQGALASNPNAAFEAAQTWRASIQDRVARLRKAP